MTLLSPLALLGLVLVPALVSLHLRRRQARPVEIPSLILWIDLGAMAASSGRRWRIEQALLLLLQILAVVSLTVVLAQPSGSATVLGTRVYVIDDGMLMRVADPAPSRLQAAKTLIAGDIQSAPAGTSLAIVAAGAVPRLLIATTDRASALTALRRLQPVPATPDFEAALRLAAGLLSSRNARLRIAYSAGEQLPPVGVAAGMLSRDAIGDDRGNQAVAGLAVRCAGGSSCNAFAAIQNSAASGLQDTVLIEADGRLLGEKQLDLPALSSTNLSFAVPAARHVLQVTLARQDLAAADNAAFAVIPGQRNSTATVVGTATLAAAVARALSAVPGVRVVTLPPSKYGTVARGRAGLLVLAGWMPAGSLPPTPSLLIVDPPRFPGGSAPAPLADTTISGEDLANPLLSGVDLTSLSIPPGSAWQLALPAGLQPAVWTSAGPLISAGLLDGRRVVVLGFDPTASNLAQLPAFPLLAANVVQWTGGWLPQSAVPGSGLSVAVPPATTSIEVSTQAALGAAAVSSRLVASGSNAYLTVPSPGIYTVTERGAWGSREAQIAVSAGPPVQTLPAAAIAAGSNSAATVPLEKPATLLVWPWLAVLAALLIAVEWLALLSRYRSAARPAAM